MYLYIFAKTIELIILSIIIILVCVNVILNYYCGYRPICGLPQKYEVYENRSGLL